MIRKALLAATLLALTPAAAQADTAVLAGGCFWGLEAVFERVKGVRNVVSGYAGGRADDAYYAKVGTNRTGHAEAVKIDYDPRAVTYDQLLAVYFGVAHDPTQLNRQGPDTGESYRSAIFPQTPAQRNAAQAAIAKLSKEKVFERPIVTKIEGGRFYPAEPYHQDFMAKNPRHPYILAHDVPKVAALQRRFPQLTK